MSLHDSEKLTFHTPLAFKGQTPFSLASESDIIMVNSYNNPFSPYNCLLLVQFANARFNRELAEAYPECDTVLSRRQALFSELKPYFDAEKKRGPARNYSVSLMHRHYTLDPGERMVTQGTISMPRPIEEDAVPERWLMPGPNDVPDSERRVPLNGIPVEYRDIKGDTNQRLCDNAGVRDHDTCTDGATICPPHTEFLNSVWAILRHRRITVLGVSYAPLPTELQEGYIFLEQALLPRELQEGCVVLEQALLPRELQEGHGGDTDNTRTQVIKPMFKPIFQIHESNNGRIRGSKFYFQSSWDLSLSSDPNKSLRVGCMHSCDAPCPITMACDSTRLKTNSDSLAFFGSFEVRI